MFFCGRGYIHTSHFLYGDNFRMRRWCPYSTSRSNSQLGCIHKHDKKLQTYLSSWYLTLVWLTLKSLKGIVTIERQWLAKLAPKMCDFSKPVKEPEPFYTHEVDCTCEVSNFISTDWRHQMLCHGYVWTIAMATAACADFISCIARALQIVRSQRS